MGSEADALVRAGFVLLQGVVRESDVVEAAREASLLLRRPVGEGNDPFSGMLDFPFPGTAPLLNRLVAGSFFRDFYESVCGREGEVYRAHLWSKFGGAASYAQELHIDGNDHSLLAPADRNSPDQLVFFLYLTRVDRSCGPTAVVPLDSFGEARNPTSEEAAALRPREVDVVAERGDCLVFTTGVAHRATELAGRGSERTSLVVAVGPTRAPWLGRKVWATSGNVDRWSGIAPSVWTVPDSAVESSGVLEPVGVVDVAGRPAAGERTAVLASTVGLALHEAVLDLVEEVVGGEVVLGDCRILRSEEVPPSGSRTLRFRLDRTHPFLSRTSKGGVVAWMAVCVEEGLTSSGSGDGAPPSSGIVVDTLPSGGSGATLGLDVAAVWGMTDEIVVTVPPTAETVVVACYSPRSDPAAWGLGWFSSIDGAAWNAVVASLPVRAVRALGAPGPENPVWSPAVVAGTARRYRRTDLPGQARKVGDGG